MEVAAVTVTRDREDNEAREDREGILECSS
jgi:hypothetical protein